MSHLLEYLSLRIAENKNCQIGYPLKIKMADHLIKCSIFSVKHDGAFDFSINQVFSVNKPVTKILEIATSGNTGLNFV